MSTLMDRIQELRVEKGIKSIRQLEIMADINVGTMKNWTDDDVSPRCSVLMSVAKVLDTSIDYLLGRSQSKYYMDLSIYPNVETVAKAAKDLDIDENTAKVVVSVMETLMKVK